MLAYLSLAVLGAQTSALPVKCSPEARDYKDLEFFRPLLRGNTLIQIGEATHGAAEFYQLKTRLVAYLHEHLGYNVLFLESGVLETTLAFRHRGKLSSSELMESSVFDNFRWKESLPLFEYLRTHPKLRVVGIDPQFSSDEVLPLVAGALRPYDSTLADEVQKRLGEGYQFMGLTGTPAEFKLARNRYLAWLDDAIARIKRLKPKRADTDQMDLILNGFRDLRRYWDYEPSAAFLSRLAIRDEMMATNVVRLQGKDKGILWAHNGHIGKGLGYKITGDYLRERLKGKTYALGLFARGGDYFLHWQRKNGEWSTTPDGLEYKFPETGEAWFMDAKGFTKPLRAFEPENGGLIEFVPASRFDGIMIVTKVRPPTKY